MATVNPLDIGRPKKYGRCGEIIHDSDDNMAKQYYYDTDLQTDAVQTIQAPDIPNPLNLQLLIDTV